MVNVIRILDTHFVSFHSSLSSFSVSLFYSAILYWNNAERKSAIKRKLANGFHVKFRFGVAFDSYVSSGCDQCPRCTNKKREIIPSFINAIKWLLRNILID